MCFSKSAQHHSKVKQRNSLLEIMENCFEMMVARCIKIGTVQTLTMLGLLPKVVTISQAEDIYGKRLITEWREKAWIKFYPANNKERGKYYVKRSELETASAMMDLHNKVPDNIINQLLQLTVLPTYSIISPFVTFGRIRPESSMFPGWI